MTSSFNQARRRLLQQGGLLATGLGLGWPGATAFANSGNNLVYSGFGGSYERAVRAAVLEPWAAQHQARLQTTTGGSDVAKVSAMVRAGRTEWDLIDAQGATLAQFRAADLLQPLPDGLFDTSLLFNPDLATPYSLPWYQFSLNIFWNPAALKEEPRSWADVWNIERFPGKRGLSKLPWFSLEIALLADGVPIDQLYPLDVDRAFASLDRIKKHAVFLDANGLANAIAAQEIVTGIVNLARLKSVRQSGLDVRYNWEQALIETQQLVVPKGAPNAANAFSAIAYALQPQAQKQILETLGYTPTLKSVLLELDPAVAADLPGTDATRANSFYLSSAWWGEHGATVGRRWQDWLANV